MELKVGDLVRIMYQPANQWVCIAGMVGFIENLDNPKYPYFQGLTVEGQPSGAGSVERESLALETGEEWISAKKRYDDFFREAALGASTKRAHPRGSYPTDCREM